MARPRARTVETPKVQDDNARRRARSAWMFGHSFRPVICDWKWPRDDGFTGVELLHRVAADYLARGIDVPIRGYVGEPYLLPGE